MAPAVATVCKITLDGNSQDVFFAGQKLSGTVDLTPSKPKKVKGVQLKITGVGCVRWTETYGTGTTIPFSGREDYLTHTVDFLRSETDEPIDLPAQRHLYRFSLLLPDTLPTSFEGDYGYIRYTVRLVLQRPWKFDLTYKIAFTVVNQLNLNTLDPPLNVAVVQEQIKHFNCGPCRSDPLTINVLLPMTGYVPGQFILTTVDISNRSNKCIAEVKLKLRRQVLYRSKCPHEQTKVVRCTLAKFQCSGVDSKSSAGYERRFLVPPEPPTRSDTIIRLEYYVEVVAKVLGMASSPRVRIPITIGTIPLMKLNRTQQRASIVESHFVPSSSASSAGTAGPKKHTSIQSLMIPHTFEQSSNRTEVQIEDDDDPPSFGTLVFAPRYPVFRFEDDDSEVISGVTLDRKSTKKQTDDTAATSKSSSSRS
ncbi:arrestin domain-containing protein 17-like [Anopheles aquasalis]|uniref:arrestin domain-containing protein 17-like n=1 Tax=Anopheles aquasalis TaxID=42839 RepID=UPI00215AB5F8|nr:arrestin domain-containing protein 17-like [Anopheles aquasalis]